MPYVLIALMSQIAQMARRLKISRRVQDPVEKFVSVKEEYRSLWVRRAECSSEVGEAGVPGADGFNQWGDFGLVGPTVDRRHVEQEKILRACGVELRERNRL